MLLQFSAFEFSYSLILCFQNDQFSPLLKTLPQMDFFLKLSYYTIHFLYDIAPKLSSVSFPPDFFSIFTHFLSVLLLSIMGHSAFLASKN